MDLKPQFWENLVLSNTWKCSLEVHNYPASKWEQTQAEGAQKNEEKLKRIKSRTQGGFSSVLQRRGGSPSRAAHWADPLGGKWCEMPEHSPPRGHQIQGEKETLLKGWKQKHIFCISQSGYHPSTSHHSVGNVSHGFRPSFYFLLKVQ